MNNNNFKRPVRNNETTKKNNEQEISGNFSETVFSTLIPKIQHAIKDEGYEVPTPIQEQCIPHVLQGRDVLGCAQTGTGKTAAFTLPLLQRITETQRKFRKGTPSALILAPTRELAAQIGDSIETYGRYLRLKHVVIFGGVNQNPQVKLLNQGVDILVATPGRLLDLINQKFIHLGEVDYFILDEVDRMLDMGFIYDIKQVLTYIPTNRQTLFFSATMPPKMLNLAQTLVKKPVKITITPDKPAVECIQQKVMFVSKRQKNNLLVKLFEDESYSKAIVFTQMKHVANLVTKTLDNAGVTAAAIHGNKTQAARTKALDGFKNGKFRVLVATDVAARGIDVDDISHVINYNLPVEAETYVHRIGRTARAGAGGRAVSFCCVEEVAYLREVETFLKQQIPVDLDHVYHSEEAHRPTGPVVKPKVGNRGGRRGSGQKKTSFVSFRKKVSGRGRR